ncbi:MAG: hypothetical protein HC898_02420 [Phycisphaerales bacterium]|nr:hypothetical protein [Phycisphaerales bacterium]
MSTSGKQRWVPMLAAMVLALVMVQALVAIMPELYWDVSPLTEPESVPSLALGPTGVAWLTVLSVIVCSLTLLLNKQANQPAQQVALALGLVGIGFANWHMISGDGMDAFRSNAWIGAVALGLAASQLMQHESARRILWAGLLALSIPLLLWAMWAIYVDHPATVKFFLQREAQTITQRGWEINSPQHLIYKRRLMQPEATGAFGFANTFGSMMTAMMMLALRQHWRTCNRHHANG